MRCFPDTPFLMTQTKIQKQVCFEFSEKILVKLLCA